MEYALSLAEPSPVLLRDVARGRDDFSKVSAETRARDAGARVIGAVHSGAAWLRGVPKVGGEWARFYEIGTNRPIYGDRDGSIHFDVRELSRERREGCAWFSKSPADALAKYEKWNSKHPLKP